MKKDYEQLIDDLVRNLKEEESIIKTLMGKNKEIASCNFVARTSGVVSGVKMCQLVFRKLSSKIDFAILKSDGSYVNRGDVICAMTGPIDEMLRGESLALSFLRYMSGIASIVNKYKQEFVGLTAELVYSGSVSPGLEEFATKAFIDGGGVVNDESTRKYALISRNAIARFDSINQVIDKLKETEKGYKTIVEVWNKDEFEEAIISNASIIRICSNKDEFIAYCANNNTTRKHLELYGDIDLKRVRGYVKLGYDSFYIPQLTDSSKTLPIDMCFYKRLKNIK